MNVNRTNTVEPTDEEILAGLRRHMVGVESLVPAPPPLASNGLETSRAVRSTVRSRVGFAGLAPLVLVAIIVVVAVGAGLSGRVLGPNGQGAAPSHHPAVASGYELVYRLVPGTGKVVTDADLDRTVSIIRNRLDTIGSAGIKVEKHAPDEIVVDVPGLVDDSQVRDLIGVTGKLAFVPLPADQYGSMTAGGPVTPAGALPIPTAGEVIPSTLRVLLDGSDIDPAASQTHASFDTTVNVWTVAVGLTSAGAGKLASWSTSHIGDYLAIVLDGKVVEVPFLQSPITDGKLEMSGVFTKESAASLATVLQFAGLPFPLVLVSDTANP